MEQILTWVKNGLLFGVISSLILLLSPNKSYEKHMNLVVGLLFILVMIHPIISFFDLDSKTYVSFIQNYIGASGNGDYLSDKEISLYTDTIGIEILSVLEDAGYSVDEVRPYVDEKGSVYRIVVSVKSDEQSFYALERYIRSVFGEEVEIIYE